MLWHLNAFAIVLAYFHVSEFTLAFIFMRKELSWQSWLFSKPYCLAMLMATIEFSIEAWLLPALKTKMFAVAASGLAMVVIGEAIRKTAMITAKGNFTHIIRRYKQPDHQLITWGIYRFTRHPGYLGWYIWAVGTQVMLVNPLCVCAFAYVSWRFFYQRIQIEERLLNNFFPAYQEYAARTPTLIPFLH